MVRLRDSYTISSHSIHRMYFKKCRYQLALIIVLGFFAIVPMTDTLSKQDGIVLSVAPLYNASDVYNDAVFDDFEAAHPGVSVVVVDSSPILPFPPAGIGIHVTQATLYVGQADVLEIDKSRLTPFMTRAGLVLDLEPLISIDPTLDSANFYPPMWESFRWDRGMWALPVSASGVVLAFDQNAFDAAGLPYPTSDWTLEDFANAARTLTQRDAAGNITLLGFSYGVITPSYILNSLATTSVIAPDGSADFINAGIAGHLTDWLALVNEGIVIESAPESRQTPMFLTENIFFAEYSRIDYVALPGGHMPLNTHGFAVSNGTQHPELAYELAKYLASYMSIAGIYGDFAAQPAIAQTPFQSNNSFADFAETALMRFEELLDRALPTAEMRYNDYVYRLLFEAETDTVNALLADVESQIRADLTTAEGLRDTTSIVIIQPTLVPQFDDERVTLRFALQLGGSLAEEGLLQQFVTDFTMEHPLIGAIDLEIVTNMTSITELTEKYDCFYSDTNLVPQLDLTTVLSLDPLMNADAAFAPAEIIGDALTQMRHSEQIWAYPLTLRPAVLRLDSTAFGRANLAVPGEIWSSDTFNSAVRALWQQNGMTASVVEPRQFGNLYLMLLIAAYGGLPFDYRTEPPTLNFTESNTVTAIQQVLNLAREGIIDYIPLGPGYVTSIQPSASPIAADFFGAIAARNRLAYTLTTYPVGSLYTPVSYAIGTAYISAATPYVDACYAWISALAQRPDVLDGFPASRAIPDFDLIVAQLGGGSSAFFAAFTQQLNTPNLVVIPESYDYFERQWLDIAFDRYVLEDADLLVELEDAERLVNEYRVCRTVSPELTADECNLKLDPTVR